MAEISYTKLFEPFFGAKLPGIECSKLLSTFAYPLGLFSKKSGEFEVWPNKNDECEK